jgi:hypothetical protein
LAFRNSTLRPIPQSALDSPFPLSRSLSLSIVLGSQLSKLDVFLNRTNRPVDHLTN